MPIPRRIVLIGAVMLAIVLVPAAVTFYTDWLWFGETGFSRVFLRTLTAQSQLGAAVMGLAFVTLFVNVLIALRSLTPRDWVLVTREGPISISVDRRRVQPAATAIVGVVAVLMGLCWFARSASRDPVRADRPFDRTLQDTR